MHLLAAKPGGFSDEEGIIDLQQTPGDVVILSAQDTSLGVLAETADKLPEDAPSVRLANLIHLNKPAAFDLYEHSVLQHCKVIIVSLLGGVNYWPYGIAQLTALAHKAQIKLILVPGDDQPDVELQELSNCQSEQSYAIWRYLREGGLRNTHNLFKYIFSEFFDTSFEKFDHPENGRSVIDPPLPLPPCIIFHSDRIEDTLENWLCGKQPEKPTALILFYRSHVQSGNTQAFEDLRVILKEKFNVISLAILSLKSPICLTTANHIIQQTQCQVVINTTSFSQHIEGNAALSSSPQEPIQLFDKDVLVIQAIMAANNEQDWAQSNQGLQSRDIAMNIALPEYDGRIISRAISFKELFKRSDSTQIDIIRYRLNKERGHFVSELAFNWTSLQIKANKDKRIALILANYPTRDGRLGNGVGLDTPASTINILSAMQKAEYAVSDIPQDGDALIKRLQVGITNDLDMLPLKNLSESLSVTDYNRYFSNLPEYNQVAIMDRWGTVEQDPKYQDGSILISGLRLGQIFVGIQPARGYNMDVVANYHDPDLVPPHHYLGFYFWLRHVYGADAISHIGKHGNLEWLPGKSTALSNQCWPDAVLGPLPHLYPFIVNDPGEGAQAKRRTQAVILDHLMPPMARAENYGDTQALEGLVDEYYQAIGLDQRRENHLKKKILKLVHQSNLIQELNLDNSQNSPQDNRDGSENDGALDTEILNQLDTYLCDLKEAQIRHGLHRFGANPDPSKLAETLVALTRLPRGEDQLDNGILHCIVEDLGLRNSARRNSGRRGSESDNPSAALFDPLQFDPASHWVGDKPAILEEISTTPWRNQADTRERLELLAEKCMEKMLAKEPIAPELKQTEKLLQYIENIVLKAVNDSSKDETGNFIRALSGRFVPAGPSGAPTRGRLDVLPTGRNFYSLDSRSIPTQSAWELGQISAQQLITRHLQDNGDYPQQLGISVWGTSTMRTGGDDIAQAFALMGVRPVWARGSNRVVDIEIIPGFQLNRPRVDVTLRISGFFRDAFPNVAKLFDNAVQTLADYEEPGNMNTIRNNIAAEIESLVAKGINPDQAKTQSRLRVFGSKPGSYGAGLQGLIDERVWNDKSDLAKAYVNWGGYSYSQENFGQAAFSAFESRLSQIDVVIQNQDNREHDLLDSDDYYQFQGGMANSVEVLKGQSPTIYHGDHSNPASPKIRTLKEELNRVIRSRVTNPKWIGAMREHGYKGAFEMAASVDYLFAYDATTNLIDDYQYASVTDALVLDAENREFLEQANPHALKEMAERLLEAQQRGLWQSPGDYQEKLTDTILELDNTLEVTSQ